MLFGAIASCIALTAAKSSGAAGLICTVRPSDSKAYTPACPISLPFIGHAPGGTGGSSPRKIAVSMIGSPSVAASIRRPPPGGWRPPDARRDRGGTDHGDRYLPGGGPPRTPWGMSDERQRYRTCRGVRLAEAE